MRNGRPLVESISCVSSIDCSGTALRPLVSVGAPAWPNAKPAANPMASVAAAASETH